MRGEGFLVLINDINNELVQWKGKFLRLKIGKSRKLIILDFASLERFNTKSEYQGFAFKEKI